MITPEPILFIVFTVLILVIAVLIVVIIFSDIIEHNIKERIDSMDSGSSDGRTVLTVWNVTNT